MSKAEEAALKAYHTNIPAAIRIAYRDGYEQAENYIIALIESRLSELLGDAQPTPILRYELRDLIKKIKEDEK